MKRIVSTFALTIISVCLFAQVKNSVAITGIKVASRDGLVYTSFDVSIGKQVVKQHQSIIPTISNGTSTVTFAPIIIETHRGRLINARKNKLQDSSIPTHRNGDSFRYSDSTTYSEWMNGASFSFSYVDEDCCTETREYSEVMIRELALEEPAAPIAFEPLLASIPASKEFSRYELSIDFGNRGKNIDVSLFDNKKALAELYNTVVNIKNNKDYTLESIEITGYASPEGTGVFNESLAYQRASALKSYLQNNIPGLNNELFTLINGGENWDGLRSIVAGSNMISKNEVLYILDNVSLDNNGGELRKKQLRELNSGKPYGYMLHNFFPKLRNAHYVVVSYSLAGDKNQEIVNQAITLIKNKEFLQALPILTKVKDDPRSWNALGVYYVMTNDLQSATVFFQKAAADGNEEAITNLKKLESSR